MSKLYEGMYKIPVVNRAVAKMEIAYNQFWIDTKEEKAVELKGKMDSLDLQKNAISQSKKILSIMDDFKKNGNPGFTSLQLKIKDIEKKEEKISNKKDSLQKQNRGQRK